MGKIDMTSAKEDYVDRAGQSGNKLVKNYVAATDKLAKASSNEAQAQYVAAMQDQKVLARRQKRLKQLTEEDLNSAMEATGATAYNNAVIAKADKWEKRVTPYFNLLNTIVPQLKPRTRDIAQNIANRVNPVAIGLHKLKEQLD